MKPENSVNIAICCDENYAAYATTVMLSIISSTTQPERLAFYLIANSISSESQYLMQREISKHKVSLTIIQATNKTFEGLPVHRFGQAVYQRILLSEYLPSTLDKVLYLDSDLFVGDDICSLWDVSLDGFAIAAVEDLSRSASNTIGIPRQDYFNSGVLLMDLKQWREQGIHWQVADYAAKNAHKLRYVDQCSLNAIFRGKWKRLHPRWNSQANIYKILRKYIEGSGYTKLELEEAVAWPAIIHFTGRKKPWLQYCFHPYKNNFLQILNAIPWATQHPSLASPKEKLRYFFALRDHWKNAGRKRLARKLRSTTSKPNN